MDIQPVNKGDRVRFRAEEFNTIARAVNTVNRQQAKLAPPVLGAGSPSTVIALVKNATGEDLERWAGVAIADPIFGPPETGPVPLDFTERLNLIGTSPVIDAHLARLAIFREPVLDGQIGEAVLLGVTPCRIEVTSESHTHARLANASPLVISAPDGPARILFKESGTGTKWALVEITAAVKRRNLFAVKVTRTGGSAGTATTAATWTYTVATLEGATIATSVPLARLRPVGLIDFAPAASFGMAFYDETDTLRLWDVQEIPQTATC